MGGYIDLPVIGGGGSGSSTLSGLTDVAIVSPVDGQVLTYSAGTGKWVNSTGGSFLSGEVATFALLPSPVGRLNEVWFVQQSTGVWLVNRKSKGFYISDNTSWLSAPEIEGYIPTAAQGNLTETGSSVLTITGGTSATIGNCSLQVKQSSTTVDGYLSSTDFNTFNNKQDAGAYLTSITSDAPLSGSGTSGSHLVIATANTTTTGAISSTDWNTFNGKMPSSAFSGLTKITVGTTQPVAPNTNDLWCDVN